ncbi:MAG: leucyl aminopeptidase [Candidatus Obscuribacterales bacterium]|nr:leucyl aminopeptidase [Candidatus Obscuribacterales bacterium]
MELKLEKEPLGKISGDVVVFGVFLDEGVDKALQEPGLELPEAVLKQLTEMAAFEKFKGKSGELLSFYPGDQLPARRFVIAGLGKRDDFANTVRKAGASLARHFGSKEQYRRVCLAIRTNGDASLVQTAVEGWLLGSYSFTLHKTRNEETNPERKPVAELVFVDSAMDDDAFARSSRAGRVIAESTCFARDLINEPACNMTPSRLAQIAASISSEHVQCRIIEEDEAARIGMGSFLGVSRGSHQPPKFIELRYTPAESRYFAAVVGKGITFDSGGLSLKTAQGMETMKYDMSGAAVTLAVVKAIAELEVPVRVLAVIAACENMPGGGALRPGDILTAMNGKTIEVNNTDAEGRLTLADALAWVCKEKPDAVIDIATLTGAVVAALGKIAAGIMSNNEELVAAVTAAGRRGGEKFWQLPLFDEYKESLKSDVADLKNAGSRGEAGSSSAGMFLKEFVDNVPWAHLDVAGTAWTDKEKDELTKGGTAFGVRTICYFLMDKAAKKAE